MRTLPRTVHATIVVRPSRSASQPHDQGAAQRIIPTLARPTTTHSDALGTTCTITESQHLGNETWQPEQSGGGGAAAESLLFFLSLPSSHERKHFPCKGCEWHRVHYLACHHTSPSPASSTLKACRMPPGWHREQPHDPDIQGFGLFSKWHWPATATFARRRCVFLQYWSDWTLRLNLASTESQIEHLPREAMRVEHTYRCI